MSNICEEFDLRLKNEQLIGTCNWIRGIDWEHRRLINAHLKSISVEDCTPKQRLILLFAIHLYTSVLSVSELGLDISQMDEEEIREFTSFYGLDNPEIRYQQIKSDIASPESFMTRIPYQAIMELYKRELVPFDRQIFVSCLVRFNVWHGSSYSKEFREGAKEKFYASFPMDDFTLDILLAVFEMEIGVDSAYYLDSDLNVGAMIMELVNSGRIERKFIQQKMFDAFNNPLLKQTTHGWVKNIYRDLAFSVEENIASQDQLIQLMYNDRNLLVNFGLGELKKISSHKSFNWELFTDSLDGIVYTEKLTGGLKTALAMLYKGLSKNKELIEQACVNLAPIFLQEDNKVQLAAQKCFELITEPNEAVTEALLPFLDTMHTEVKTSLSVLLADEQVEILHEGYKQVSYVMEACNDQNKIKYIENEDDFIFLTSKVLKSNEALDYELFLEGLTRFHTIKETDPKALKPALKQAEKLAEDLFLDIDARKGMHHVIAAQLICMWLSPEPITVEMKVNEWKERVKENEKRYSYSYNRWQAIFCRFGRIEALTNQLVQGKLLPLLSTPTHGDFEIELSVFVDRLKQYQEAKQLPHETDFSIALARLNRSSAYKDFPIAKEYNDILTYLLDQKAEINTNQIKDLKSIWLTAYAVKKPGKAIDALLDDHNGNDWLKPVSSWDWSMGRKYSEDRKYSWARLDIDYEQKAIQEMDDTSNNSFFGHHLTNTEFVIADVSHYFSRDGYLQDPLYLDMILRTFRFFDDLEASETKSTLEVVKYSAAHPMPLSKAGNLFLVMALFCNQKTIRIGAFDWLSMLIENNYLDIEAFTTACCKLIASTVHPIPTPRLVEQFDRMFQCHGKYIDVLYQVLETSLADITTDKLPKGFSKVLHQYYEVLQVVKKPIPDGITKKLEEMINVNTVKKEVKKLLSL